jgi:hypothetical protein
VGLWQGEAAFDLSRARLSCRLCGARDVAPRELVGSPIGYSERPAAFPSACAKKCLTQTRASEAKRHGEALPVGWIDQPHLPPISGYPPSRDHRGIRYKREKMR